MTKGFSLLTWLAGEILAISGFTIIGIAFELVSKVSGRKQYAIWMEGRRVFL